MSEVKIRADLGGQRLVVVVPDERHVIRKSVDVAAEMEAVVSVVVRRRAVSYSINSVQFKLDDKTCLGLDCESQLQYEYFNS